MPLTAFDHVNIRTANLDAMVAWYGEVLGLHPGPRPDFPFAGAWLYLGDTAVIHLVAADPPPAPGESLGIEHVSFRATDHAGFIATLEARVIPHRTVTVEAVGLALVNIHDPDGNHLHIDFPLAEAGD
ncbi:MAG: VOC family protein [Pseudomonadota bacterium]